MLETEASRSWCHLAKVREMKKLHYKEYMLHSPLITQMMSIQTSCTRKLSSLFKSENLETLLRV